VPDRPDRSPAEPNRTSSGLPLSADAYHGSYNDYLWQLALADGEVPDGRLSGGPDALPAADRGTQPATGITGAEDRGAEGRTIDGVVIEPEPDEHHD
jgi:hypothetical protein